MFGDFGDPKEPFGLFSAWVTEARAAELNDPDAAALATTDPAGRPNVRMVLVRGADERGFVFYTNAESVKGEELKARPEAALLFHWKSLRRQVRIRGSVEGAAEEESDAYFISRARESQLGAWASRQSRPLASRATLDAEAAGYAEKYRDSTVPRPPHWRGFRVVPLAIEFWKEGAHRLHDRMLFTRTVRHAPWERARLYP